MPTIEEIAAKAYEDVVEKSEEKKEIKKPKEESVDEIEEQEPETLEEVGEPEKVEEPEETENFAETLQPDSFDEEERSRFEQIKDKTSKKLVKDFVERYHYSQNQAISRKMHQLNSQYQEALSGLEGLDKIKESFKHRFEDGTTPASALENSLEWDDYLEENSHAAIAELMQMYGVSPHDYIQGPASQNFQPGMQPQGQPQSADSEIQRELDSLKATIAEQQQTAKMQEIGKDLNSFKFAKDNDGRALYPLFDQLEVAMVPIVQGLKSQFPQATNIQLLHEAYKAAYSQAPDFLKRKVTGSQKKPAKNPSSLVSKASSSSKKGTQKVRTPEQHAEAAWEKVFG